MENQLTPELCREYLKAVIDPEIYQNIVDLGVVSDIQVYQGDGVAPRSSKMWNRPCGAKGPARSRSTSSGSPCGRPPP